MVTSNIDVQDGLVNGACGVLDYISFEESSNKPILAWMNFHDKHIGNKARAPFISYIKENQLNEGITPLKKIDTLLNLTKSIK